MAHDFSDALRLLKTGKKVARMAWTNMHLAIPRPGDKGVFGFPHIVQKFPGTANEVVTQWINCNQDILENDWVEVQ